MLPWIVLERNVIILYSKDSNVSNVSRILLVPNIWRIDRKVATAHRVVVRVVEWPVILVSNLGDL